MKTTDKYTITICGFLLVFFLIELLCLVNIYSENLLHNIIFAQLLMFSLTACTVIVCTVAPMFHKVQSETQNISKITKIVLLSDFNTPTDDFSLINRTSALIKKGGAADMSMESDSSVKGYAVVNRVENEWYVERISEERTVALKRAGEQYIYKLKMGMCYRLNLNDILYVEKERLLVT